MPFSSGTSRERPREREREQVGDRHLHARSRRALAAARRPSAASSPPIWTCGICCQLATMFLTTAARSPAARRRPAIRRDRRGCPDTAVVARSRTTMRPPGAAALHGRELDPVLCCEPACRRRGDRPLPARRAPRAPPLIDPGSSPFGRCRHRIVAHEHGPSASRSSPSTPSTGTIAPSGATIADRAGLGRLDLDRRLVGLDLDEHVALRDPIAVGDEPAQDLAVLHRDRQLLQTELRHASSRSTAVTTSSADGYTSAMPPGVQGMGTSSAATRSTGRVEVVERLLHDAGRKLGTESPGLVGVVRDRDPHRAPDGLEDRLHVERCDRARVDHFDRDASLGEPVGGSHRLVHHARQGDHRSVGAFPDDARRAEAESGRRRSRPRRGARRGGRSR